MNATDSADGHVHESVRAYYGQHLQQTSDLKTSACCEREAPHALIADALAKIPREVLAKFYGCGTPIPLGIEGLDVLDLGSGSGRDAYVVSALVGPQGSVTGVDMTPEQLAVARRHVDAFTERLEYAAPNMRFVEGFIECLADAGVANASKDLVISNCVINLSPRKDQVLREVFRALRDGGEFFFSDVYATRRLPDAARQHHALRGECIGGALYVEDFKQLSREVGFGEPRVLAVAPIEIQSAELADMVGSTQFYSITFRCFKVANMEPREREEDYGHVATYLGTIPGHARGYELDAAHYFETRRPERVGGNTAAILKHSWLRQYFKVDGDWSEHFGAFTRERDGGVDRIVDIARRQQNSPIPVGTKHRSPEPVNKSCGGAKKSCC